MSPLKLVACLAAALPFFGGCAVAPQDADADAEADTVSVEAAISTRIRPGNFKLYLSPGEIPYPNCDVYTQLEIVSSPARATLTERVDGVCNISLLPDSRTYRVRQVATDCGSIVYIGGLRRNGELHALRITDHRSRMCNDLVPAQVTVEEIGPGPNGIRKLVARYSHDAAPTPPPPPAPRSAVSCEAAGGTCQSIFATTYCAKWADSTTHDCGGMPSTGCCLP
jgi:hypothetical protein